MVRNQWSVAVRRRFGDRWGEKSNQIVFVKGWQQSIHIALNNTPASSYFFNCDFVFILSLNDTYTSGQLLIKNSIFCFFENNTFFIEPWLSVYKLKIECFSYQLTVVPRKWATKTQWFLKNICFYQGPGSIKMIYFRDEIILSRP